MIRTFALAGGARLLGLPLAALSSAATTYFVLQALGVDQYAAFALLIALPAMVPFTDFGLGAAVTNAAVISRQNITPLIATLRGALPVSLAAALVVASGGIAFWVFFPHASILGTGIRGESGLVAIVLIMFAPCIPLGLGARVLVGIGKTHLAVLVQSLAPAASAAGVWVVCQTSPNLHLLVLTSMSAVVAVQGVTCLIAFRWARKNGINSLSYKVTPRLRMAQLFQYAGPMIILQATIPITFQLGRYILAHGVSAAEVAAFSLVSSLYLPCLSIVQSAGQSLWSSLSGLTARRKRRGLLLALAISTGSGFGAATALVLIGPWIAGVISGDKIVIARPLFLAFALLLLVQAFHVAGGMAMMDVKGVRLQAACSIAMAAFGVVLTWWWVPALGASAPPLAAAAATLSCMALPILIFALRRHRRIEVTALEGVDRQNVTNT